MKKIIYALILLWLSHSALGQDGKAKLNELLQAAQSGKLSNEQITSITNIAKKENWTADEKNFLNAIKPIAMKTPSLMKAFNTPKMGNLGKDLDGIKGKGNALGKALGAGVIEKAMEAKGKADSLKSKAQENLGKGADLLHQAKDGANSGINKAKDAAGNVQGPSVGTPTKKKLPDPPTKEQLMQMKDKAKNLKDKASSIKDDVSGP